MLNMALACVLAWAVAGDYCLIKHAPQSFPVDAGAVAVGLAAQGPSGLLLLVLINAPSRYLSFLGAWVESTRLRAVLLVLPFALLLWSHDPIAYGMFTTGVDDKIESARRTESALQEGCSVLSLLSVHRGHRE
jgi:hypothetical protein